MVTLRRHAVSFLGFLRLLARYPPRQLSLADELRRVEEERLRAHLFRIYKKFFRIYKKSSASSSSAARNGRQIIQFCPGYHSKQISGGMSGHGVQLNPHK